MKRTSHFSITVGAAAAILLAGCGGGSDGGTTDLDAADVPLAQAPAFVKQYAGLFNSARAQPRNCGATAAPAVSPLTKWNPKLQKAAQAHADDMYSKRFFSHTGSDGSDLLTRTERFGYAGIPVSENLAVGFSSTQATFNAWMKSPGHCLGIMVDAAQAVAVAQRGKYVVMVMGN